MEPETLCNSMELAGHCLNNWQTLAATAVCLAGSIPLGLVTAWTGSKLFDKRHHTAVEDFMQELEDAPNAMGRVARVKIRAEIKERNL